MLELQSVSKRFGAFLAIDDVSLAVRRGEKHAIIGPNGAGKTTLFNLITGQVAPSAGRVLFEGRDVSGAAPHDLVRLGMGRSFQRINIFPRLSVFENVQAARIAHHRRQFALLTPAAGLYRDETQQILETVDLAAEARVSAGHLSYGKQKQIELAVALALEPRLLLLDEPTAGMSPAETHDAIALIGRIAETRGLTLLFTEHDMAVVFSIADRISVLHQGALIASGSPEAVRLDRDVQRVYLGEAAGGAA
jgi:branched-chain amino acid transport system ATP-binding protein